MDTSDVEIKFDEFGMCNHCQKYFNNVKNKVFHGQDGLTRLEKILELVKNDGRGKNYDCIIGLSGGVDSSYALYLAVKMGIRPLAVHMDNGWDTEIAVKNIENLCEKLNVDLITYVLDWKVFKELQLAFLRASTPDSEIPSDHAIWAVQWEIASKYKIKYIFTGCSTLTESHIPRTWSQGYWDNKYIRSVYKTFTGKQLKNFPNFSLIKYYFNLIRFKQVDIIDFVDYDKQKAKKTLIEEVSWKDYGGKHFESIYTRFYQGYLLPNKFGFDKRRSHLSSQICAGMISRENALNELMYSTYSRELQLQDVDYVCKKLGISNEEFEKILNTPARNFDDYPNNEKLKNSIVIKTFFLILRITRHMYYFFLKVLNKKSFGDFRYRRN